MKRTMLALAIAGLSVAAYASPPPGGGPPGPIDVNVTNGVLPVSVQPNAILWGHEWEVVYSPGTRSKVLFLTNDTGKTIVLKRLQVNTLATPCDELDRTTIAFLSVKEFPAATIGLQSFPAFDQCKFLASESLDLRWGPGDILQVVLNKGVDTANAENAANTVVSIVGDQYQ